MSKRGEVWKKEEWKREDGRAAQHLGASRLYLQPRFNHPPDAARPKGQISREIREGTRETPR